MRRVLLLALALLAGCARQGMLRVAVTDGETGKPLDGALVTFQSTMLLATTGPDGATPEVGREQRGQVRVERAGYLVESLPAKDLKARPAGIVRVAMFPDRPRTVIGRVVDAGTKTGIEGVEVDAAGVKAKSAAFGAFTLTDFPVGLHNVSAALEGYATACTSLSVRGGDTARIELAMVDTTDVGSVNGRVTDRATGAGISGVLVEVLGTGISVVTDSLGSYCVQRLSAGEHVMRASIKGRPAQEIPFRVLKEWAVEVSFGLNRFEP
ncbi:MAG: carboxypeptidase regulatory-like domain-containing protein [bacterium]